MPRFYRDLYDDKTKHEHFIEVFMKKFNRERIESFTRNWWNKKPFAAKKALFGAAIELYLQDNLAGFIGAIKTLYTEIDGLLRILYTEEKKKKPTFNALISFVVEKARQKFSNPLPLSFDNEFYDYLKDVLFASFDLTTGNVDISRHSAAHGVAGETEYSKMRALQGLLILDQLYFYLYSPQFSLPSFY